MVEMVPVDSRNLVAVGYDSNTKELYTQFKAGTYVYYNVPEQVYENLMAADSIGKYHAANIVGVYAYKRLL